MTRIKKRNNEKLIFVSVLVGSIMLATFVFSVSLSYFGIVPVFTAMVVFTFVCGIGLMLRQLWNWNKNHWMTKGRKEAIWEEIYLQDMYKKKCDAVHSQRYDEATKWRDKIERFELDNDIKWVVP